MRCGSITRAVVLLQNSDLYQQRGASKVLANRARMMFSVWIQTCLSLRTAYEQLASIAG